jgi:hypothetical protein
MLRPALIPLAPAAAALVLSLGLPASVRAQAAEPARGPVLVGSTRPSSEVPRRDYALLIGVDRYDHFPRLNNPVRDASEIEAELKTFYGFDTTLMPNPTEAEILEALKKLALKTYGPEDQVFIFYAGHGEVDEVDEGYIAGTDSVSQARGGRNPLSHAYVQRIVSKIAAKHVFLVLDSCFSGTFDPRISSAGARSSAEQISGPELLSRNLGLNARLWLSSGRKEAVSDGVSGQGSPFARMLLDAFRSYGGDSGIVTTANIFSAAQGLRTPPAWGELPDHSPGGQFVFAVGGSGHVTRPKPLPPLERERPQIAALLDEYRGAYRNRSVEAVARIYPSLPAAERNGLRQSFTRDCRAYDVAFDAPEIFLTNAEGTAAQVTVDATYSCTPIGGQKPQRAAMRDVYHLRKVNDAWVISSATSSVRP